MASQYTQGPWEADYDVVVDDSGIRIATIADRANTPDALEANARLIAAAPDLLFACRAALTKLGNLSPESRHEGTERALRDAIRKAGGR